MNVVGYGLDIAGYSTGKSGLAKVTWDGSQLRAVVFTDHPFSKKRKGDSSIEGATGPELDALRTMLDDGRLCVDVPIDLQGLPNVEKPTKLWHLTKRQVDWDQQALAPLADRLGAAVARFAYLHRQLKVLPGGDPLGKKLFETYPAASLRNLWPAAVGQISAGEEQTLLSYKRLLIKWSVDRWTSTSEEGKGLVAVAHLLHLRVAAPDVPLELDDDEVDAIVCALTAMVSDGRYAQAVDPPRFERPKDAPDSYLLLTDHALAGVDQIHVEKQPWQPTSTAANQA